MRATVYFVVVVLGMVVLFKAFHSLDREEQAPTPAPTYRTEFVLNRWYCCLLDDHPVPTISPFVGGFGGRSGRPVTE
jgi:hypothetical protein